MNDEKSLKLNGLNVVRFFAFFWVLSFHSLPLHATGIPGALFAKFNSFGYLGVNLFFVLSSFLLTYLGLEEVKHTGRFSVKNFLARRALRIMPLYYFIVIASFILLPYIGKITSDPVVLPSKQWYFFFFLSNYNNEPFIYALKYLWSIAVEEQFYWSWALALIVFGRNFKMVTATFMTLFFIVSFFPGYIPHSVSSLLSVSDFTVGGAFALLFFHYRQYTKNILLLFISIIIISASLYFFGNFNQSITSFLTSILFALILLAAITICSIHRISSSGIYRLFDHLGIYTYGLYIYSGFVLTLNRRLDKKIFLVNHPVLLFLVSLAILIPLSIFSYHFFEKRFLRFSRKFSWQKNKPRPIEQY
jgi:peptidoglycan/LPS O-acetylase OafA/YrhL